MLLVDVKPITKIKNEINYRKGDFGYYLIFNAKGYFLFC